MLEPGGEFRIAPKRLEVSKHRHVEDDNTIVVMLTDSFKEGASDARLYRYDVLP